MFGSAVAICGGAIVTLPSVIEFVTNYSKFMTIMKDVNDSRPLIMSMIEGDLTTKLCEKCASITEFNNVGDEGDYLTRPLLEKRILQASEQSLEDKGGNYTIIVAAKGAGKTFAAARMLREKKGLVALLISDKDTPESIISKLVKECGIEVQQGLDIDLEDFGPVLLKAAEIREGRPITIVFEVEITGTSLEELLFIKNFAKYLAVYASVKSCYLRRTRDWCSKMIEKDRR